MTHIDSKPAIQPAPQRTTLTPRHRRGLVPKILDLAAKGQGPREISRVLGCSQANASKALWRSQRWRGEVAPLPPEMAEWLNAEARRTGARVTEIARALLIDAITEAMDEGKA